jgi:hypothetical protein
MSLQLITLTTSPNQQLTASLTVDGNPLTLNLAINYDEMAGYWVMAISDSNQNLLMASVPMLCGSYPAANLLKQQRYLAIGSAYIVNVSNLAPTNVDAAGGLDYPDSTNLGTDFQLWWGDTPSV